jgi:hypothetical protein
MRPLASRPWARAARLQQQHPSAVRRHAPAPRRVAAAATGDDNPPPPPPPPADDELWIERELRARKRKRDAERKAAAESSAAGRGASSPSPSSSGPLSGAAALEQGYVRFLAAFFGLILLDGVVLATSGFLPESVDAFAERVLYPSFSPIIGTFLLCSSLYGLWKAGQGGSLE